MQQILFKNQQNQVIGRYNNKLKLFSKEVRQSIHRFRKWNAWGIQSYILYHLEDLGCEEIMIIDIEDDVTYSVDFTTFLNHAVAADWGDGQQHFLNLNYFKSVHKIN